MYCKAGLSRGFVDYSENGEQIHTQRDKHTHTVSYRVRPGLKIRNKENIKTILIHMISSQVSKCSEASVIEEERNITNFEKLTTTIESISTERIKMKKPLKDKSTRAAVNDVAKIIKAVVETVKPSGDSLDQIKLAADAVDKLKNVKAAGTDIDESLTSLIEHFQNVANPEIKRSLLGEISKKISLVKLRKIVKNKITLYE